MGGVLSCNQPVIMKVLLLLAALPYIMAQTAAPMGAVKPCCTPERMEGMVFNIQTGKSTLFAVDHTLGKRLRRDADNPATGWTLEDFNTLMTYVHDGANCVSYKVNATNLNKRCIPDDAMYIGSGSFGPTGGQPYDAFQFSDLGFNETIAVSKFSCIPIVAATRASPNMPAETRLFINLDANVTSTDSQVFAEYRFTPWYHVNQTCFPVRCLLDQSVCF